MLLVAGQREQVWHFGPPRLMEARCADDSGAPSQPRLFAVVSDGGASCDDLIVQPEDPVAKGAEEETASKNAQRLSPALPQLDPPSSVHACGHHWAWLHAA